jgi:hypothetical protein
MPPLGIAYLAAVLKNKNFEVEILDINIDFFHEYKQYARFWDSDNYDRCLRTNFFLNKEELNRIGEVYTNRILATGADIIGFSVHTTSFVFSTHIASRIKTIDPKKIVIFGGPECRREEKHPESFLQNPGRGDYIVLGEGEITLVEIIENIRKGGSLLNCKGVVICEDGQLKFTGEREEIKDLDILPMPDFSLFPLEKYLHKNSLPLLTSRGCIKRCVFCVDISHQQTYRCRSYEKVVKEILYCYKNYNLRRLKFSDLLLNGNLQFLEGMCNGLMSSGIKDLFWNGSMIIRSDMPRYLFKKMYKSGCRSIAFGVESASPKVLKLMNKNYGLNDLVKNLRYCKQVGILSSTNWIVGFPGESREDIWNTMKFIIQHLNYIHEAPPANKLEIIKGAILYKNYTRFKIQFDKRLHEGKWTENDNTIEERDYRQTLFNEFLAEIGILNTTFNSHDNYLKKSISYLRKRKILRKFKKKLIG